MEQLDLCVMKIKNTDNRQFYGHFGGKMKKVLLILILSMLLVGCGTEEIPRETSVVSGIITDRSHFYYTTYLTIETEDGIKIPIYESYSIFSDGVKVGDKVRFEVEKVEGSGYRIIGILIE